MSAPALQLASRTPAEHDVTADLPHFSPALHRWFLWYLRRYFARHFDAVRVSREGRVPRETDKPLIVYTNHPSWWDPIHFALVSACELPARRQYGPMDAEALERYKMFTRMGMFPVERGTRRGTIQFVRSGLAVLSRPGSSLWISAEGEFTDPRRRPVRLRPGLAHLVRRLDDAWIVPLAVEYPFWNERKPEALSRFGEPIVLSREPRRSVDEWTSVFEERLGETMDALSQDASTRDPACFRTLVSGKAGVGGVYDAWRRLRALVRGQRFDVAHDRGSR